MTFDITLFLNDHPIFCPLCGEKYLTQCRCIVGERECKNGHSWWNSDKPGWIRISTSPRKHKAEGEPIVQGPSIMILGDFEEVSRPCDGAPDGGRAIMQAPPRE